MSEFTKLKIISDGTAMNTKVVTEDGKILFGVTDIVINIGMNNEVKAVITVIQPEVEVNNVKAEIVKKT